MSTKAELEARVAELEQAAQGISPGDLRLFSFIYAANLGPLVVSAPPTGADELKLLKNVLETIVRLVEDRLLQVVAQEAVADARKG